MNWGLEEQANLSSLRLLLVMVLVMATEKQLEQCGRRCPRACTHREPLRVDASPVTNLTHTSSVEQTGQIAFFLTVLKYELGNLGGRVTT